MQACNDPCSENCLRQPAGLASRWLTGRGNRRTGRDAYLAYVSNERDNTISVVDLDQMKTIATVPVGQRPRGITLLTKDGSALLVGASDDDPIEILETKTLRIVGTLPSGPWIPRPSPCTSPAIRSMSRTKTTIAAVSTGGTASMCRRARRSPKSRRASNPKAWR